ncbi:MAG: hypothetical protein LUE64_00410 [Candidatus Gastranaerophilales bacterium]|nr:hypothetical protein [Candidatus Gastranaerophilales bacterium]
MKNRKKKAQHVVEFSLIIPFFIIIFTFVFQALVETYAKYKFSYVFSNAVRVSVNYQPVYSSKERADDYDFRTITENILSNAFTTGSDNTYESVDVARITSEKTTYLIGTFKYVTKLIFGTGGTYFYFTLPVSNAFVEPVILDNSSDEVDTYFDNYYTLNSSGD